jgi:hypothetical protein
VTDTTTGSGSQSSQEGDGSGSLTALQRAHWGKHLEQTAYRTPASVSDSLLLLEAATGAVDKAVGDVESSTVQEAAQTLANLRVHIAALRQCEAGLERWIATCFREEGWRDPVELPGIGMVEVRRSTTRRAWDWPELKTAWLNAYTASTGGEVTDPADIRDALFESFSVSAGKVGGLRELGIEVSDYSSCEPGTPRVVLS